MTSRIMAPRVELRAVADFSVNPAGVTLAGEEAGEGIPVVLLHGLTATRRYVVMGSRSLERSGHRVVAYDARGARRARARRPTPTPTTTTTSSTDLRAVLDDRGIERAVLAGASMGAHTAAAARARRPRARRRARDRHAGVRPRGGPRGRAGALGRAVGGPAHAAASTASSRPTASPQVPEQWKDTIDRVLRQRLAAHEHPEAVADALRAVPRSRPFEAWDELGGDRGADGRRGEPRRGRPRPPLRGRRGLRRADPGRASCVRGARQLAAGLAGRAALEGDQRAGGASGRSRAMISSADSTTRSRS